VAAAPSRADRLERRRRQEGDQHPVGGLVGNTASRVRRRGEELADRGLALVRDAA
jgi:hypothetical protein